MEDRELRRAMAKASLRESWLHAKASGLDQMNDEEIGQEIKQVRRSHKRRRRGEARRPGHEHNPLRRHKSEGAPAKLVMDWVLEGQVQLVTSPLIVEEYRAIVERPKFHRFGFPPLWLEFLIEESMCLPDPGRWPHAGPDPKDLPLLALAHSTGAWLVTGNLRHFPEEIREGITVLSPADYLAHLVRIQGFECFSSSIRSLSLERSCAPAIVEGAVERIALNHALNAGSLNPPSKRQHVPGLRSNHQVLFSDRAFDAARLIRSFEMTFDHRPLLL